MDRFTRILPLAAVAGVVMVAGCLDTVEAPDVVEARIAHAAPGLGGAMVFLEGDPIVQLAPGNHGYFLLNIQSLRYTFATATDTADAMVGHRSDITAIVFMNAAEPAVREYGLERQFAGTRILVISGVENRDDPITVVLEGSGDPVSATLEPAAAAVVEPGTGTISITIHFGDPEEAVTLPPFTVHPGDNGFLVIMPHGSEEDSYLRMVF